MPLCDADKLFKSKSNVQIKIKSSLHSRYYAEACNEWRGPSPRFSAWETQLRRNVATVTIVWQHCADLTDPGIKPQTSCTDIVRLATELIGAYTYVIMNETANKTQVFHGNCQGCGMGEGEQYLKRTLTFF